MKGLRVALVLLAVLASPAILAVEVFVDHDGSHEWSAVQTYGWRSTSETAVSDLARARIVGAVDAEMKKLGVRQVESDPDVWITFHAATREEFSVDMASWGYGYPAGMTWDSHWEGYYGGGWDATTTVREYTRGTLVIDIWDAGTDTLILRGVANGTVPESPKQKSRTVKNAVSKMVKKWRKSQRQIEKAKRAKG